MKDRSKLIFPAIDVDDDSTLLAAWEYLSGVAKDTLICLCEHGPTYDGDVPSKSGRNELLNYGLAVKICMGDRWWAATYLGRAIWKVGYVEPRKEIVRKLVPPNQVRNEP